MQTAEGGRNCAIAALDGTPRNDCGAGDERVLHYDRIKAFGRPETQHALKVGLDCLFPPRLAASRPLRSRS